VWCAGRLCPVWIRPPGPPVATFHHPDGLRGEEIAMVARTVAVVDSFEVMAAVSTPLE
jgi:hypothetical protein